MQTLDYIVLVGYFVIMIVIGIICSMRIKGQEDFFMGGRGFGKLLQTFAAFGAGTGSQDPINVGRTTWTSGLSGIWSALMWLFITPFYWIFAVWYRRMRHLTLGDWFVERYESRPMGVAYTLFAFTFYIFYLSTMFSAIGKVAAPLLGEETVTWLVSLVGSTDAADLKYLLVPVIAIVVIAYGVLGGLAAAYWTDLIQGVCIIVLSVILIPYGLSGLVDKYGEEYQASIGQEEPLTTMDGFAIMHDRVTAENFQLFGGPSAGEFPLHFIVSLTLLGLMGIVVQPHFIATGGGSAKTENAARIGLVVGNFLKRLCTIGWALTGLIVLALLADNIEIARDPDQAWGVASREILGQLNLGLVGLMLACLLAALMSSADCYMLVTAALVVRNVYAPFINPNASEKTYITAGRFAGLLIIIGASAVSLIFYDVFAQYKLALEVATVFAAPFWIGMFWRRATKHAAWISIVASLTLFFIVPWVAPVVMPSLRTNPKYAITNDVVTRTTEKIASAADVSKRQASITIWNEEDAEITAAYDRYRLARKATAATQADGKIGDLKELASELATLTTLVAMIEKRENLGDSPAPLVTGETFTETITSGGKSIFFKSVKTLTEGELLEQETHTEADGKTVVTTRHSTAELEGQGSFNLDYLVYAMCGMDLEKCDNALLTSMRLPPRMITPFVIMIALSLVTRRGSQSALDRYYVKMKTPVEPDPEDDQRELTLSYAEPTRYDSKKLLPGTDIEIQRPTTADVAGFIFSVGVCVAFLALAHWLANIGS